MSDDLNHAGQTALALLAAAPVGPRPDRTGDAGAVRDRIGAALLAWSARVTTAPDILTDPLRRWQHLVSAGRTDTVLGRLAEADLDARVIAAEAGRDPVAHATYGVWASQSGRTGVTATPRDSGWDLHGLLRFCSGAHLLDRALITARTPTGDLLLVDVDLADHGVRPLENTWRAVGMDASDSGDVRLEHVQVDADAVIGPVDFYLTRPGFPIGGIGVAAVWWGASYGLYEAAADGLRATEADDHQSAHLGALTVSFESSAALLVGTAGVLAHLSRAALDRQALVCRSAVDAVVEQTVRRVPRITGPVPASRDAGFAHRLADLPVYVRQHHAERDLAALGRTELSRTQPARTEPNRS